MGNPEGPTRSSTKPEPLVEDKGLPTTSTSTPMPEVKPPKKEPAKEVTDKFVNDLDQFVRLQSSFSIILRAKYDALIQVGFNADQATRFCDTAVATGKVIM